MRLEDILTKRRRTSQQRLLKYLKYVFNDHFMLLLFFLIGALAYQYQQWLVTLHGDLLLERIVWAIIAFLMTRIGQVATYLEEADLIFLLPMEYQFNPYFKRAEWYSLYLPAIVLGFFLFLSLPFLKVLSLNSPIDLFCLYIQLFLLKISDLRLKVTEQKQRKQWLLGTTAFLSVLLSTTLSVWIGMVGAVGSFFYFGLWGRKQNIQIYPWLTLITRERIRVQRVDQLLALFVSIPTSHASAKRRRYLDVFLQRAKESVLPETYLFSRMFWRGSEYYPLWLRLNIITLLLIYIIPMGWGLILVIILMQYVSHFQLIALYQSIVRSMMLQVYPIDFGQRDKAFMKFIKPLILGQACLFAIATLIFHLNALGYMVVMEWGISALFCLTFYWGYLPFLLRKTSKKRKVKSYKVS